MRSSWLSIATAFVISLAAVGCGGDEESGSEPDPSDPSEPSATASEPTESSGTASEPSPSPRDSGTESPPPTDAADLPSERDLRLALLTLDDVPKGWVKLPGGDSDGELCDFDPTEALGFDEDTLPKANVVLSANQSAGPTVGEGLAVLPPGRGSELLGALRKALDDCEGEQVGGIPLAVSKLDYPTLADDSAAYLLHLGDGDSGYDFPMVYAIHGDLTIGLWAHDTTGDPVDLLREYAPLAVEKAIRGLQ